MEVYLCANVSTSEHFMGCCGLFFFLMIRRPPRSTQGVSSAASDVYKRQVSTQSTWDDEIISKNMLYNSITPKTYFFKLMKVFTSRLTPVKVKLYICKKCYEVFKESDFDSRENICKSCVSSKIQKENQQHLLFLSLIHISEPTRPLYISYAVFCLKKKKTNNKGLNKNPKHLRHRRNSTI
eukprot:TRINITY_DN11986_c0_g1_i3.p1 TRINITY_DN11986_c0_g1~~TRINITY_DN11986_c0_g1_i3.p1  ORF type:complete len:181 (-),score=38.51 TRINITY_DN11986_c0_g1_i3:74-616(-)